MAKNQNNRRESHFIPSGTRSQGKAEGREDQAGFRPHHDFQEWAGEEQQVPGGPEISESEAIAASVETTTPKELETRGEPIHRATEEGEEVVRAERPQASGEVY